jgi:hypothetical protein
VVGWVNLAQRSMYIIKTGLGFVGCQSINQSEFNYQACEGRRWQAPAQVETVFFGGGRGNCRKKKPKKWGYCVCVCVCVCWKAKGQNRETKS